MALKKPNSSSSNVRTTNGNTSKKNPQTVLSSLASTATKTTSNNNCSAAPTLKQAESWFDRAQDQILSRVRSLNKNQPFTEKQRAESANQMKLLATSSDTKGIKFSGLALQYQYFQTKFTKRAILMYSVLLLLFGNNSQSKVSHLGQYMKAMYLKAHNTRLAQEQQQEQQEHEQEGNGSCFNEVVTEEMEEEEMMMKKKKLQLNTRLNVCSIGGGPGNDSTALVLIKQQFLQSLVVQRNSSSNGGGGSGSSKNRNDNSGRGYCDDDGEEEEDEYDVTCDLYDLEKSWKNYVPTLREIMSPHVGVEFSQCDVTKSLHQHSMNRQLDAKIGCYDLFMFSYVCNETSAMSEQANGIFWREMATGAKKGAIFVFVDVIGYSQKALKLVERHMRSVGPDYMFTSYDLTNEKIVGKAQVLVMQKVME